MHSMRNRFLLAALLCAGCAPGATGGAAEDSAVKTAAAAPSGPGLDLSGKRGTPLQAFQLKDVRGVPYRVAKHIGKDVIMISFWATWCGPCKQELAAMSPVYDELAAQGFVYLAISTDGPETLSEVRSYVGSYGYAFPVLLDSKSTMLDKFHPTGTLPFYLLVNRNGEIVEQHQGFSTGDEAKLRAKVISLLGEGS